MENKYPKILIVDNFNQRDANGITIYNLFSQWPEGRIAVVHIEKGNYRNILVPNVKQYFILGNKEVKYIFPFSLFLKIGPTQIINEYNFMDEFVHDFSLDKRINISKVRLIFHKIFTKIFLKLGIGFIRKKFIISSDLERWIECFKPDFIYSSGGNISTLRFVLEMKNKFNVKFILHTFDDYLYRLENSFFSNLILKKTNIQFHRAILKADKLFSISDKMSFEFERRFGKKFHKFHNPVNRDFVSMQKPQSELQDTIFRFGYFGKINEDVSDIISIFIDALPKNFLVDIEFHIFSQSSLNSWIDGVGNNVEIHYKGSLPYTEIPKVMSSYNGLLLPLTFKKESRRYLKLSLSTKTSEYMISGVPIFLLAPIDFAVSEYLIDNKAAFVVSEISDLTSQIKKFVMDGKLRDMISQRAYKIAINEHTVERVSERLLDALNTAN
jgi:glycosyltransferase involved in cell wall biosynthesis